MDATLAPVAAPIAELLRIERGAPAAIARVWAEVIHDAFDGSLTCWPTLPRDRGRAVETIAGSIVASDVFIALDASHHVLGVAFAGTRLLHFDDGGMQRAYGAAGARWRLSLLGYLGMRTARSGTVALEGFAVVAHARGRGIGTTLLGQLVADARARGAKGVELTVGDSNPARRLYERFGFRAIAATGVALFGRRLGFSRLLKMRLDLGPVLPED